MNARVYITAALVIIIISSVAGSVPENREYLVKAAFIEKFARYIEWPDEDKRTSWEPFVIGIYNDNPFGDDIFRLYKKVKIKGRDVEIKVVDSGIDILEGYDILYVPNKQAMNIDDILAKISGKSTLVIGEYPGLARIGAHINFFINENRNINFEMNLASLHDSGFNVNISLIEISKIVK